MRFFSLAFAGWLLLPLTAGAQAHPAVAAAPDSVAQALRRLSASSALPGFAVAVVDSGGIRYEAGFGLANRAAHAAFTPRTVQEVGSVSKTLIGLCLLKGVELGYFTLDTEVNAVLPGWAMRNPHLGPGAAPITIRHLATHTTGILDREKPYLGTYIRGARGRRMRFDPAAPPAENAITALPTFLRAYLAPDGRHYHPRNFAADPPGAAYHYTNIGAALAAHLLEIKSGLPYAEFARRYVLAPAGMTASSWTYAEYAQQPHAVGYRANGRPYGPYFGLTYPDGGLHTSAHDLALYLQQVIRGAAGRPGLLTAASFRALLAPQWPAAENAPPTGRNPREPNTGIFWAIRPNGERGHLGSDPGVFAALFFNPQTGVGRVFLTNVDFDDNPAAQRQFAAIWKALDGVAQ